MSNVHVNSYGHRRRIHLHRQPRVTKKRGLVEYYSLATCSFEDGKNQKKILVGIGELTKQQAEQYRLLLSAINGQTPLEQMTDIEAIVFGDERQYLDDIIRHYKGKHVVENAFRELKSFIELRPIYVWTETHVKAHYDVSVMACFINNYINVKLKELDRSLRDFHAHLARAGRVARLVAPSGLKLFKLKKITDETRRYFQRLGISDTLSPHLHRTHGVCQ